MTVTIRRIEPRDEFRWRELWDGYTRFYEREPAEPLTRHTWARIMDPASPVLAIVAETEAGLRGSGGSEPRRPGVAAPGPSERSSNRGLEVVTRGRRGG